MAQTPPSLGPTRLVTLLAIVMFLVAAGALVLSWIVDEAAAFPLRLFAMTAMLALIPTITRLVLRPRWKGGRVVRSAEPGVIWAFVAPIALETALYLAVLVLISTLLLGTRAPAEAIFYAGGVILIIEIGGTAIEAFDNSDLERLSSTLAYAMTIRAILRSEWIVYLSAPTGVLLGAIAGLRFLHTSSKATISLCLEISLSLASVALLSFLLLSFYRMASIPEISEGDIYQAYDISDANKVCRYDALHNVILITAFVATLLRLLGLSFDIKWFLLALLVSVFVFAEAPFTIGQLQLRQAVLGTTHGKQRAESAMEVEKYIPLLQPWPFIAGLATTGTASGLLFILLSNLVEHVVLPK